MKKLILVSIACFMLSGCTGFVGTNTRADAMNAPEYYEHTIKNHLRATLKDPNSMTDFYAYMPELSKCAIGIYGPFHGWRVRVHYNAKNSYGGYVGLQTYYYWFHGETLKGITKDKSSCPLAAGW